MISYGKQTIEKDDIEAIIDVLNGDWLTQGPAIDLFEKDLCDYFGSQYACAVSNGTAALHLAAIALGWSKGDIILTTPITFLAIVVLVKKFVRVGNLLPNLLYLTLLANSLLLNE